MSRYEKKAKCPNCLPDMAGAYFDAAGFGAEDEKVWICRNCGHKLPRRTNRRTEKVTPSQQRIIDRVKGYGWTVELKFIGRDVWLTGTRDLGNVGLNLIKGDRVWGTIGPRGCFKLTLTRLGPDKELRTDIELSVYLT